MATLKTCRRCRYFQGVVHYKKDSVGVLHDGIAPGWYVGCGQGKFSNHNNIYIPDALDVNHATFLYYINYQALMEFLRLNANRGVECPRGRESKNGKNGKMESAEQLALF